jgi:hypothetical protein
MMMWWYIDKYDPFHLPTWEQVQSDPARYPTPRLYPILQNVTLVLCPVVWLQNFTTGGPAVVNYSIWVLGALFDGAILYCVGLLIDAARFRTPPPKRE